MSTDGTDELPTKRTQFDAQSEAQLIERAKNSDYSAYEQLYQIHTGRIYALCVRLLKDRELAEDFTQDAFVKAWQSLPGFRGDSALSSWLHRIATNLVISHLRKENWFNQTSDDAMVAELPYVESTAEQISLEQAISRLPDGARSVFVLHSVEGYTHQEIATMTGLAVGSSKAHLHRAKQLLQAMLA